MPAYCGLPVRLELSLPGRVLDLMDVGQGFRVAQLDLGFPEVREDATDAPDQSGTIDTTSLFGARAVTIAGTIIASAAGSRSRSLSLLTPFMDPAARPVLTYQTEPDADPRTLTLRAVDSSSPLDSLSVSKWSASWKAPAGLALGTVEHSAICGPSWLITEGRGYPLVFDRVYPAAGSSDSATITPGGDYPTPPVLTIWGPATGARITVEDLNTGATATIELKPDYVIAAGHYLVIDCGRRTIVDDFGTNVYGDALEMFATWPVLVPNTLNVVSFFAEATAGSTRLVTTWFDRWLI